MSFISVLSPDIEVQHEDKTYKFAALTFKDLAEYVLWYQYKEVDEQDQVTKNLPQHIREKILIDTHERCRNKRWVFELKNEETGEVIKREERFLSFETPEIQESLNTPAGISYQAYLSLRRNHPDMTPNLANSICKLETYDKILAKLNQIIGVTTEGVNNVGELKPNQ